MLVIECVTSHALPPVGNTQPRWQPTTTGDAVCQSHRHNPTFHTFLDLDSIIYLAVNGTVTSLSVLHPKYNKLRSEDELSF